MCACLLKQILEHLWYPKYLVPSQLLTSALSGKVLSFCAPVPLHCPGLCPITADLYRTKKQEWNERVEAFCPQLCPVLQTAGKALFSPFTLSVHLFPLKIRQITCFWLFLLLPSRREWLSYCHRTPSDRERLALQSGGGHDCSDGDWIPLFSSLCSPCPCAM